MEPGVLASCLFSSPHLTSPVSLQHLGCAVPDCVEMQEMICESCMNQHVFLWAYAAHLAGKRRGFLAAGGCCWCRLTCVGVVLLVQGPALQTKEEKGEQSESGVPKKEETVGCPIHLV